MWKRIDIVIILIILLVATAFRLYKLNNTPLTDKFSSRQTSTAAVARNFSRERIDILSPKADNISHNEIGLPNPEGYRYTEFPIYNASFAVIYKYFPLLPLETYGRLISILFSLILICIIYYITLKEDGRISAIAASFIMSIMPFFVFYSRVVLPDMMALSLMYLAIISTYLFVNRKSSVFNIVVYILGGVCASLSLLINPTLCFFLLPILYLFILKYKLTIWKSIYFYYFIGVIGIPLFLWNIVLHQHSYGEQIHQVLFQSFKPESFHIIFERIINIILGGFLIVPLLIGFLKKQKTLLFYTLSIASLCYLFIFLNSNEQYEYYQIAIFPILAILSGIGIQFILSQKKLFTSQIINIGVLVVILVSSFFFSYDKVKNYYTYDYNLVNIGKVINTLTTSEDKIITDTNDDTTLLYLADRKGFPKLDDSLINLKNQGATYFVTLNKSSRENYRNDFKIIFETNNVYILDLNQPSEQ